MTSSVSLPIQASAKLGASWGVGNRLIAFPSPRSGATMGKSSSAAMSEVSWETTLYDPIFRKLVNESSQAFFSLQSLAEDENSISSSSLVQVSHQYRSVIRDCQLLIDQSVESRQQDNQVLSQDRITRLEQQSELLYKLELVWNLVEILSIEKQTFGIVLPQLLQWIALHFPQADEKARKVLEEFQENPEAHPDYWEAMQHFVCQGRKDQSRNLLRLHSEFGGDSGADAFASLDELIRKMPVFNNQSSVVDFNFRWTNWQNEVNARLDEGEFSTSVHLSELASLMAGSDEALSRFSKKCETWYQWMTAKLLFTCPDVKSYDLALHAEKAISKFGGLSAMTSLDSILLATMESDIAQLMNELCTSLDNFWFPAHLLDLLHHADQLEGMTEARSSSDALHPGPGLREFLLLEYATSLMSHKSMWQVGALYMDHCPTQGKFRLECILSHMPLDGERKANKVIGMASQRGLTGVVSSTCKVMGMKAYKENRIGTAMAWALRSQDVYFTTFLADRLLHMYCESGTFSAGDLLDNLGSSMVLSDRLTFLAKYREFHKLCSQSEFKGAADLLHSLMWSRLAPKYFWITLLIDALPFLEAEEVFLSSEQTYELMHCLQELAKDSSLPKKQQVQLEEHEPQIRLQLSQNLAKALMDEGDAGSIGLS